MSLQSLYQDITNFWDNIAPLVVAHLAIAFAAVWISKMTLGNGLEHLLRYFRSASYYQWKRILGEFDLMPKIPFIAALALLVYLAILSSLLNLLTIGFTNPLAFAHSDSQFWLETNDAGLTYYLVEVASYQTNTSIDVTDIMQFRDRLSRQYELSNPEEYRSYVSWPDKYHRQWSKYYQAAIAVLVLFLYILIRAISRKSKNIHYLRLSIVIVIVAISILATRYVGEQYIEKENTAKMYFVARMMRNDPSLITSKLSDEDIQTLECHIYYERRNFSTSSARRQFWISKSFEKFLPREFKTNSEFPWSPPTACQQ